MLGQALTTGAIQAQAKRKTNAAQAQDAYSTNAGSQQDLRVYQETPRTCVSRTRESRNIGSVMTCIVRNGCTKVVPDRVGARVLCNRLTRPVSWNCAQVVCIACSISRKRAITVVVAQFRRRGRGPKVQHAGSGNLTRAIGADEEQERAQAIHLTDR